MVEKSSINKGLLNVLGAIMFNGCSNSLFGWFRRKVWVVSENHRYCQDNVIPKYFKYAMTATDNDQLKGIISSSNVLLSALIAKGYVLTGYSSALDFSYDGFVRGYNTRLRNGIVIDSTLAYAKNYFGRTLLNMRWDISEKLSSR